MDEERWQKAIEHAREMLELYKKIPTGIFGALHYIKMMIRQSISLYGAGDRSEALLEALEGIQ